MKKYNRVMLGQGSKYAKMCRQENYIGADFEIYMDNMRRVNSPTYLDDRTREYKRNHMKALENVFGDDAKDVIMKIRMMKPADYRKLLQSDEDMEISYIYDPSQLSAKLNQIRASLNMNLKEEYIEDV